MPDGAGTFRLGTLVTVPAAERPDLVGAPTLQALQALGLGDQVGVVEIDPHLSETAATEEAYAVPAGVLANCVIVAGKREGIERIAACLVLATTTADVNATVKRRLDVRKASFLPMERAVELTRMAYGAINPIGLPAGWRLFVDARIPPLDAVLIGSGVRRSKLVLPGALVPLLAGAEVVEGLGVARPA